MSDRDLLRIEGLRFLGNGPLDLAVAAGECVTVSGPSGAGKTLLLRAIADLDESAGRVTLGGEDRDAMPAPEWRRRVALLMAESVWWRETVGEHFAPLDRALLQRLGFPTDVATWAVSRLSSGERQRLGLARLLTNRPRALLLDEPTANLDRDNIARVETIVAEYREQNDAAVLWVTHDAEQAARVGNRGFRLERGTLHPREPGCLGEMGGIP
jgi:ABC-type iron transport system FetAB ATPase subunit